jgi:hypothetical protein
MPKTVSQKTKGKLSKKELKQDKLVEFAYKAERYYHEHQKLVFGIVGAIVVILVHKRSFESLLALAIQESQPPTHY